MSSLFLIQLRRYTRFQVRCFLTVSRCDLDSELMQRTHTNKLNNFPYNLKIFRLIPHLSILYTQTEKLFWYFSQGNAILRGKKDAKLWINCNRKSARSSRGMETFLDVAGKYIDREFFFLIFAAYWSWVMLPLFGVIFRAVNVLLTPPLFIMQPGAGCSKHCQHLQYWLTSIGTNTLVMVVNGG